GRRDRVGRRAPATLDLPARPPAARVAAPRQVPAHLPAVRQAARRGAEGLPRRRPVPAAVPRQPRLLGRLEVPPAAPPAPVRHAGAAVANVPTPRRPARHPRAPVGLATRAAARPRGAEPPSPRPVPQLLQA